MTSRPTSTATRAPRADRATPILFSDRGCPFAHRILALVAHLGVPIDRRESSVGDKPAGLELYSAAKRIPLLVHGDLVLTESSVIAEHLAEYYDFVDAYPRDIVTRSLHRHAIALVDRTIVPMLFGRMQADVDAPLLGDALRTLAAAATTAAPGPSLLNLHVAPMWQRVLWWQPTGTLMQAIQAHPALRPWLDATIDLPCVTRTAPDRDAHVADLGRARQAGLIGPSNL